MNISHYPVDSNRAILVAIQGTNQSKYLTSDYFLPSSSNAHYYSKKYSGNHTERTSIGINHSHQLKFCKIARAATVSLIFLSIVTGEVFAGDKLPKSKANASRKKESTFETIHLSNNLPDVVPTFPLPDLIPSNPSVTTPPPPPPMPDIVPPVILPDVVPVPPAPPAPPMAPSPDIA